MQGRLESELKKENKIINTLSTMPECVSDWYYNLKASNKTAASCNDFINKVRRFLLFIDKDVVNIDVKDITLNKVQQYFISIQKKIDTNGEIVYTSDSYQQTVWCCLNNFFSFLVKTKKMETNYMELIDKPKNKDLERINQHRILLTKKDFNEIIKAVNSGVGSDKAKTFQDRLRNRDLAIILLFMTTGMRKTALSEINIEDLDLDNEVLYIIDKGNKTHKYNLSDKVVDALYDWIDDRDEMLNGKQCDALFISDDTYKRLSTSAISKLVSKYCEGALGYHISPHKLRAGFCSILYKETNNVEFVRRAVGHSNITTTQRYIVTDNDERVRASSIMNKLL